MAVINFGERWSVRQIDTTQKVAEWTSAVSYIATTGTDNESHWEVYAYADVNGPLADDTLVRSTLSVQQITATRYYCLYTFVHPDSEESEPDQTPEDPSQYTFTTSGGQSSVTQSLETKLKLTGDGPILDNSDKDNKQVVQVDPETGKPTPVNIITSSMGYTEKKVYANPLPCTFLQTLRDATGTTNDADWKCFSTREVLFTGVTGNQQGTGDWELVFSFQIGRHIVNADYPDPVDGFPAQVITYSKEAHDFFWVMLYPDQYSVNVGSKNKVWRPAIYVERMYDESDYSLLGLGT